MKKTAEPYVFDTSALLTLWNDKEGSDSVEHLLRSNVNIYVSFMSYMESRYRLWENAGNNLSVCDSWVIATAISADAVIIHKDPEFEQVKKIVKLKALPYKPPIRGKKRK
jgi:predicted nucleic acid-binding protein